MGERRIRMKKSLARATVVLGLFGSGPAVEESRAYRLQDLWSPEVWGPGETMVWYFSSDNWPADARSSPEQVMAAFARSLAEWSDIPTADISWRVEGPISGLELRRDGIQVIGIQPDASHGDAGSYPDGRPDHRLWYERNGSGRWVLVEHDFLLTPAQTRRAPSDWDDPGVLVGDLVHPLGHVLGLEHAAAFPANRPRFFRAGERDTWPLDPNMSYGETTVYFDEEGSLLRMDDRIGASLLRPAPGWLEATGTITGSVRAEDGPLEGVHVWALRRTDAGRVEGVGAFVGIHRFRYPEPNVPGSFLIEGLPPGDYVLWAHPDLEWLAHPWFFEDGQGEFLDTLLPVPVRVSAGRTTAGIEIVMRRGRPTTLTTAPTGH